VLSRKNLETKRNILRETRVVTRKNMCKKLGLVFSLSCLGSGSVFALGGAARGADFTSAIGIQSADAFMGMEAAAVSKPSANPDVITETSTISITTSSSTDSSIDSAVQVAAPDTHNIAASVNASGSEITSLQPIAPAKPVTEKQDQIFPDLEELVFVGENKILMDYLFSGISGFVKLSDDERSCVEAGHAKGAVYGEIPYDSLQVILDNELIGPNDVFYDFGSGCGKVVTQVYLNTPVKKAVGIEASFTRYNGSVRMMQKFKTTDAYIDRKYNAKSRRNIAFINKNFLKVNVSDATVIYMCATCFAPDLMDKLVRKFAQINRVGLRVITLKKLPDHEKHGFRFDRGYKLPMSWSRNGKKSSVFVYTYVGHLLR
jgi:precorrin-6B methylase 2